MSPNANYATRGRWRCPGCGAKLDTARGLSHHLSFEGVCPVAEHERYGAGPLKWSHLDGAQRRPFPATIEELPA